MAYTYRDKASSTASAPRSSGAATLAVVDGTSFGTSMSADSPMPLVVYDSTGTTLKTVLACSGRTANNLTIAGTVGAYDDSPISIGDKVGCVPSAVDFNALWAAVASKASATAADALDARLDALEDDPVTMAYVDSGLAGKASTTTADALDARIDALVAAPKPIVPLAKWVLATSADLTTSGAPGELADLPAGYTLHSVRVNAAANPSGGGFSFNVTANGSGIFSSSQAHPANSTTSAAYTGFATSSLSAGDLVGLSIVSTGSGVRHVVITLYGREV